MWAWFRRECPPRMVGLAQTAEGLRAQTEVPEQTEWASRCSAAPAGQPWKLQTCQTESRPVLKVNLRERGREGERKGRGEGEREEGRAEGQR